MKSLTGWSQQEISVKEVSDKFVKFGDAYKTLKKAYSSKGINVSHMPDIPGKIRLILEKSLVLPPSPESLECFLPGIGASIAELMTILKDKKNELDMKERGTLSASSSMSSLHNTHLSTSSSLHLASSPLTEQPPLPSNINLSTSPKKLSPFTNNHVSSFDNKYPTAKDPLMRLQNNNDLKRRASKRYSAYQTSSILSMQSPVQDNSMASDILNGSPSKYTTITANDLENAKNITNIESIAEDDENSLQSVTTNTNILQQRKEYLDNTINSLSGKKVTGSEKTLNYIFLKLRDDVKKVNITLPTTSINLKMLFSQKFNYTPPGAAPFPDFNIQETPNSITYQLENVKTISYGSIISLKQPDIQTAIFKHVDSQISDIKNDMMNMEDRILKTIEKMQFSQRPMSISKPIIQKTEDVEYEKQMKKKLETNNKNQKMIDDLQDEIIRIKQHQTKSTKRLNSIAMETVDLIDKIQLESLIASNSSENSYVKDCKNKVSQECETLVEKLDVIQDAIDFMKVDITKRGIKPTAKQLDNLAEEMKKTQSDLENLTDYTQSERKNLTSFWNRQLTTIANDQKFFKAQEEIMTLLVQDYQSSEETYHLIISCAEQLEKGSMGIKGKIPVPDPTISQMDASKLVMAEVNSINPNHEERIEAIQKAERVREMERDLRMKDEFQEELGSFVNNDMLKKSTGGIDELEKKRQEKDQQHIKNTLGVI